MRRFLMSTAVATGALALAACGSSDYGGSGAANSVAPSAGADTVSVVAVSGVGNILIDSAGKALYSPDEEATGSVLCVDKCTSFWVPLVPGATGPTAGAGTPTIAVVDRPDGIKQVTAAGRPLYTFSPDGPGKVTGDGVADDFGTQHFTWHVIMSDGSPKSAPATPKPPSPYGGGGY
jgi:predicted lipoprotein with Yx(FWY)xxD motif